MDFKAGGNFGSRDRKNVSGAMSIHVDYLSISGCGKSSGRTTQ